MNKSRLDDVLDCLRKQREDARNIYGIEFVGVVGSVARGEDGQDSDVDILMNVVGHTTYFRIGELEAKLEAALGRHVDLVDRKTLRPQFQDSMERDLVPV
jgi:predicted nucleotidyltransferase